MKNIKQLIFPVFMMLFVLVAYFTLTSIQLRKGMTKKQAKEVMKRAFPDVNIQNAWNGSNHEARYKLNFKGDTLVNWTRL